MSIHTEECFAPGVADRTWAKKVIHGDYHPHIDGLRCLAVLPVLLYHLQMRLCPAGFMGVDVFFVISGYLICGGIIRELETGSFSIKRFYFRRIRRIFPAYFAVVVVVLLASLFFYYWARIVPLAQTALFSAFFSTNIYFWLDMGYFQPNAHGNPLLHLWSLGVEEQFYIIIPATLLMLSKVRRKSVVPVILIGLIASLAFGIFLGQKGQSTTAFYILPTRGWELLTGALVAALQPTQRHFRAAFLSWLGFGLVIASFWCFTTARTFISGGTSVEIVLPFLGSLGFSPFPGWVSLPIIAASALLIRYGETGVVGTILSSRLFVAIGRISYSLYLWHWPVIVFARYINYEQQNTVTSLAIVIISFLAAYLSWRWIEMPIRVSPRFTPRRAFVGMSFGCAILALCCALLIVSEGLRNYVHQRANAFAWPPRPFLPNLKKLGPHRRAFHPPAYPAVDTEYIRTLGQPGRPPTFCLVGESHAEALAPGLDKVAASHQQTGIYVAFHMHPFVREGASSDAQQLLEWVAAHPDIRDVYLVGRWIHLFKILDGLPQVGDKGRIKPVNLQPNQAESLERELGETAQWFTRHGKRVFIFSSVPEYGYHPADIMARSQIIPLQHPIEITRQDYLNRQASVSRILAKLQQEGLFTVIHLETGLFSGDNSLFMSPTGRPYYSDGDHLTPEGAERAAQAIAPQLWPKP